MESHISDPPHSNPMLTEVVLPKIAEADGLLVSQRPIPTPGSEEVIVQVLATGISFAERAMLHGRYPGQPKFPFVPGYDLVGQVTELGSGVDSRLLGTRVAAVTKTGAWSTHVVVQARDLVPMPNDIDPAEVETVAVNGITAWQMLHRKAKVQSGQTILVHGANGGVGTILVQLARHSGVRVIGTASLQHHDDLRALGVEPIDYHDPDLAARVRGLAPVGVHAVFDHLGGTSFRRSFDLLVPGGTLVAYGTGAGAQLNDTNNQVLAFLAMYGRLALWTATSKRRALFYNFWAGKHARPKRFRRNLSADLSHVVALLSDGTITAQIAVRFPLVNVVEAMEIVANQSVRGKVILEP